MEPTLQDRVKALEKRIENVPAHKDMVVIQGRLVRIERKLERLLKVFRLPKEG